MNNSVCWYTLEVRGKEGSGLSPDNYVMEYEPVTDNSFTIRTKLYNRALELLNEGYEVTLYYNEVIKTEVYTLE